MAGTEAGCFHFLGFLRSKNPKPRNGMDAAGRDAGCFHFLGFLRSKNPKPRNGMDAISGQRKG
jgi:hypothetical protein